MSDINENLVISIPFDDDGNVNGIATATGKYGKINIEVNPGETLEDINDRLVEKYNLLNNELFKKD